MSATLCAAMVVFAAACSGASTADGERSQHQTSTTKHASTTTSSRKPTTTATSTTAPAAPAPAPAVPVGVQPPMAAAGTVRPPAEWVTTGVPKAGSMFEDLSADHTLDGLGKFVALTFDDGPSQYTKPILDILKSMAVRATFFELTPQSQARPEVVKELLAAGMHLGAHSRHHPEVDKLDIQGKTDEVQGSIDDLNAIVGAGSVKCFRPPFGRYDQQILDLVAGRQVATAMWSVDTRDWEKPAWPVIVARTLEHVKDRSVILMHDGGGDRTNTIQALPWIIQTLRDQGYQFVTIC